MSTESNDTQVPNYISLSEAANISGLSAGHLRLLVRQGKIWGTKIGRDWLTTQEALEKYLSTERRPGPKSPKDSE